jgi:hypothetical protein
MSDIKTQTVNALKAAEDLEKLKKETEIKKIILDSRRINNAMDRQKRNDQELELAKSMTFGALSQEEVDQIQKENRDYINAAKSSMKFIDETFDGVVPYFRKNLILICGKTGEGKSTTVANIVWSTITQKNPVTGKGRRALVITNEEQVSDIYNRIACLSKGWHYTNHDKFTTEQIETFEKYISNLGKSGRLRVIDNNNNGAYGSTASIEGIKTIFDNLLRDKEYYDVIILDYYQNVKNSKIDHTLNEWQVQARLANLLDTYKNVYPAPIVVMAQVKPSEDSDDPTPVEFRIKGTKVITDPSTMIMEMVADRENLRTKWIVWKSRFTEAIGKSFFTGYDKGKFVQYGEDHIKYVNDIKAKQEQKKLMSGVFDKKEGKDGNKNK